MKKRKIGLALGGGAARGLAHIGVLEILEREKIPIDMIAGASAGAAIGALFAQGKNTSELKELVRKWDWKQRAQMLDLSLPKSGFIAGKKIKQLLESIIGDIKFSDLKLPFACVATDINTGEEIVINQGSVLEAVRASISIPIIFTAVKRNGRYLVDGGLVNPVPVSVLKNMGADFIIAVNVMPRLNKQLEPVYLETPAAGEKSTTKEPNIFSIILKIFSIINGQVVDDSLSGADIIIEPHLPNTGLGDFSHADECILRGGLSAIDAVIEIKRQLAS